MAVVTGEAPAPFLLPTIYTPALTDEPALFVSDGPKLRALVAKVWRTTEAPVGFCLDLWQAWLIDRVLERYPDDHPDVKKRGRLRYRQVVISIPRQNGKSVIGAILAMYGLVMHELGPQVLSVASSREQAQIVYDRVLYVIQVNPTLAKRFKKATETRGIITRDGTGKYLAKASKGDALQGIPVSFAVPDELHITKPAIWQSLVNGILTRRDGMIAGVTTAGDDESELLQSLYVIGNRAANGDKRFERFGFFVWQAPEASIPDDDEALALAILASNPFVYEAHYFPRDDRYIDIDTVISDVRGMPENDAIRYRFNLFVASVAAFIPIERWNRNHRHADFPKTVSKVTFAVDRTPDWNAATITANVKIGEKTHTEVVASIVRPTLGQLADLCTLLARRDYNVFVMDGWSLRDLGKELERRGMRVKITTQGEMMTASSLMFAKIMRGTVVHSGDELLTRQIPNTIRKNHGEGYRISRRDSAEIDGVMSTTLGVYGAETIAQVADQIF